MCDLKVVRSDWRVMMALLFVASASLVARPVQAQEAEGPKPWWIGFLMGYGSTELTSDLGRGGNMGTLTMAFSGGRSFGQRLRVGFEIGGWLLESGDLWDPSKGESLSQAAVIAQLAPVADLPLFVEAGAGLTMYTNHRPLEFGSWGAGWMVGAGWAFDLSQTLRLVPSVNANGGRLRDIDNALVTETGLRYSVWGVRLGLRKDFGRARTGKAP
jgi:hypothetical protein